MGNYEKTCCPFQQFNTIPKCYAELSRCIYFFLQLWYEWILGTKHLPWWCRSACQIVWFVQKLCYSNKCSINHRLWTVVQKVPLKHSSASSSSSSSSFAHIVYSLEQINLGTFVLSVPNYKKDGNKQSFELCWQIISWYFIIPQRL